MGAPRVVVGKTTQQLDGGESPAVGFDDGLNYPMDLAVIDAPDWWGGVPATLVYVCDMCNHRVALQALDPVSGEPLGALETVAGGRGSGEALDQLFLPEGIAVHAAAPGNVLVADTNCHRVVEWVRGASEGTLVAGDGRPGSEPHLLDSPTKLAFTLDGRRVLISDTGNGRVVLWDRGERVGVPLVTNINPGGLCWIPSSSVLVVCDLRAEDESEPLCSSGGTQATVVLRRSALGISCPNSVSHDPHTGSLLVCDQSRHAVLRLPVGLPEGTAVLLWGSPDGHSGRRVGELGGPSAAWAHGGHLYVSEIYNHRVIRVPMS